METPDLIKNYVSNYFNIKSTQIEEKALYFIVWDYDRKKFVQLVDDLDKIGYLPFIDEYEGDYKINIAQKPEHKESRVYINVILFLATIITTVFWGYMWGGTLINGIAFSMALLAIIGTHELAHYFATKKHGVKATLPYFIPFPLGLGTMGAVINVKSAIPTKNALFDLGVSGPIAGFIITIPVLIIGILLSHVAPLQSGAINFPSSLLMQLITNLISPQIPQGYDLYMHPVALAGWVGLVITMLNLIPVGSFDGGHISRSIFPGKIHQYISIAGILITLYLWYPMGILMTFLFIIARKHPGALDNVSEISKKRKIIAIFMIIIFILCLAPMPHFVK